MLNRAIGSFTALKRIIDDILDFSKIEANKLSLVSQPFRLDTTFREVAHVMGRAAYEKDLEMWIDIAPECPREVLGDAIRVNQILFNLANNAIKFTESGEVKLSVSLLDETDDSYHLGFSMSDTGVGMSEQEVAYVFEAFKQASDTTHSKFGGTGLGLSIVKQLIELMDGDINIVSEKGKGTCFEFSIKLKKTAFLRTFKDFGESDDVHFYEALLLGFDPTSLHLVKRQCSILGWTSRAVASIEEIKNQTTLNNSKRQVLIVDERIYDDAAAKSSMSQALAKLDSTVKVLVARYGSSVFSVIEQTPFDNVIVKPFTPSTLYDAIVNFEDELGRGLDGNSTSDNARLLKSKPADKMLSGLWILVAEDNEINQMVFTAMLEDAGASVVVVNNGQECIDKLADCKVDLICMDLQKPVMDGISATKIIRENTEYDSIPIVALTANAMEEDRQLSIEAGMQRHVSKPVERTDLINVVRELILNKDS